jgi:hypothetical protein
MREGPSLLQDNKPLVLNEIFVGKACKAFDSIEIKNHGDKALSKNWGKYWKETISGFAEERLGDVGVEGPSADNAAMADGYLVQVPKGEVVLHKDFKVPLMSCCFLSFLPDLVCCLIG